MLYYKEIMRKVTKNSIIPVLYISFHNFKYMTNQTIVLTFRLLIFNFIIAVYSLNLMPIIICLEYLIKEVVHIFYWQRAGPL